MTEAEVQEQVADYIRLQYPGVLFHSDFGSGAKLSWAQAKRQKRQNGGRRAWPDMFIAEPIYEEIEAWKPIKGYEDIYEISDHGRVARTRNGERKLINPQINKRNGYQYAHLCKNNSVKAFRVHRLVAEHFIPNPNKKSQVNHIDGDKANNFYTNLEWASASENQLHRFRVLKKPGGKPRKTIKCVETGEIFESIAEATRKTGIGHIRQVVAGERAKAGGYRWQEL